MGRTRVCLFSHFDRDGIVAEHVAAYVEALAALGFEIHFVSTAPLLSAVDRQRLRASCANVVVRQNTGLDFGSWCHAWRQLGDVKNTDVLLANDSVYGPIRPLEEILARATRSRAAVCGLTDSHERRWHLQSYFLLFKGTSALDALSELLDQPFEGLSKDEIIKHGELHLPSILKRRRLLGEALFPYQELDDLRYIRARNPTHFYWRELLERGFPFIKVELLRDNPQQVMTSGWTELIGNGPVTVEMIDSHLKRVANRPPLPGRIPRSDVVRTATARIVPVARRLPVADAVYKALRRSFWRLDHGRRQLFKTR